MHLCKVDDNENQLISLMIWLLNHPDSSIRLKAFNSLEWLGNIEPDMLVMTLIKEACLDKPYISTISSSILLKFKTKQRPEAIISILSVNPGIITEISTIKML